MTTHMQSQIMTIITTVKSLQVNCSMTAMQNDGRINKEEARQLRMIDKAANRFIRELEKIR